MLKTFTLPSEQDSVRTAFNRGQRATTARLSLGKAAPGFPEYLLKQDDIPVAILRGKELVCGGEHFAGIPEVAYTGQQLGQPEDYPLPEPLPLPSAPPAKISPWTFWYQSQGQAHQVLIESTYEDAQRAWDKLSTIFDMTSQRP